MEGPPLTATAAAAAIEMANERDTETTKQRVFDM